MPLQAAYINGRIRLLEVAVGDDSRKVYLQTMENERRLQVDKRRVYYAGEQYEQANREACEALGVDWLTGRLPEHKRLHAYSTQVGECVDFIANQMAKTFEVVCTDPATQTVVDSAFRLSPAISPNGDQDDLSVLAILLDILIAGDTPCRVHWDNVNGAPYFEFWESEQVRFDYNQDNREQLDRVEIELLLWVPSVDGERQAIKRDVYRMEDETCIHEWFMDDNEEPEGTEDLSLPFIPWVLVRAQKKSLSAQRGESIISQQAMETADRYNAVEQVAWLIARYNSHGNLAVVGDAATLKAQQEEHIEKDVADVLTFPGGTSVSAITLPTDPDMIIHQRDVLLDSIYGAFGLTRIDQTTISGYGTVSGYALEILNRKTDGTFDGIKVQFVRDLKNLLGMALDMQAIKDGVELAAAYPDREMEVRLGGSYIVDDVLGRDDFVALLISRREALRQRGYADSAIDTIEGEIEAEKAAQPAESGSFNQVQSGAGSTLSGTTQGGVGP